MLSLSLYDGVHFHKEFDVSHGKSNEETKCYCGVSKDMDGIFSTWDYSKQNKGTNGVPNVVCTILK